MPGFTTPATDCTIDRAVRVTPDLVAAFAELVPQLSPGRTPPGQAELQAILDDERTYLLVARTPDGTIAGAIALVFYRVPTGLRARIEDLIVSRSHRRLGLGKALMQRTIHLAREQQAHVLDLTSNPSRGEANRLYLTLGFQRWETNVYRMILDAPPPDPAGGA
ncbi:MAG: GNAT family N-acetyltransferase [Anaerolineales bacterium]|nr:GNAT family N-acetyltransferase [Anaerolineales bacterium]